MPFSFRKGRDPARTDGINGALWLFPISSGRMYGTAPSACRGNCADVLVRKKKFAKGVRVETAYRLP